MSWARRPPVKTGAACPWSILLCPIVHHDKATNGNTPAVAFLFSSLKEGGKMAKTNLIAFRATPEQRRKLELLARGEGTTITGVLRKLVNERPVRPVRVRISGLALAINNDSDGAVPGQSIAVP